MQSKKGGREGAEEKEARKLEYAEESLVCSVMFDCIYV